MFILFVLKGEKVIFVQFAFRGFVFVHARVIGSVGLVVRTYPFHG